MHIKHMHEMIERLTSCTKTAIENDADKIGNFYIPDVVDMIKDLNEASYYASIVKAMKESEEEDEAEEKYIKRMLKEERADEYKRMREQYGDEEGERRFYDNYRYANGRFAPKGRGSYMPRSSGRRGYVEPPYYHMMPDAAEWYRDMDRMDGKMYYTPMSGNGGNMGSSSSNSNSGNMGGNSRGYSDGYNDGNRRGYEEGYERGKDDGRRNGNNSQSRFDKVKRGYEETKEAHKGNTAEDKQITMREAEKMVNVFMDGLEEALEDSPIEVKNMVKTKATSRLQKMS